jgi:hypothetical protein
MEDNTVSIDEIKKFAFWMSSRFSDEAYEFGLTDKEEEPKLPE